MGAPLSPSRHLYLAVALVSAAALGYEVLLTRLLSIVQWHHYAYMVVSLALLGFGASGAFLTLGGKALARRFELAFSANAGAFGLSAVLCFSLAQSVPFNPLELIWSAAQTLRLGLVYLLLMVPFFAAANCMGLAFMRFERHIPGLYGADLVGAGIGSAAVVALLYGVKAEIALQITASLGLAAALVGGWPRLGTVARVTWTGLLLILALASIAARWLVPAPSQFKELSQALAKSGARIEAERSSPLGLVTALGNRKVPFRHAPGLSLTAGADIGAQVALFVDGGAMTVIPEAGGETGYLDFVTTALPYHLLDRPNVLVLGAGGGASVVQALAHGAERVEAVEVNPDVVALVREDFAAFSGGLYDRGRVHVAVDEARAFVGRTRRVYDLIQIDLLDSFSASSAGLYALSESHVYTVEALEAYLRHLEPNGILALTRWVKMPPRDGPRLFATAVEALRNMGVPAPDSRLAWIRSWNTSTLLIRNGTWTATDIAALRAFCERRAFDTAYYPGMPASQANRHNRLPRPWFHEAAVALLGPERETFLERYKFNVRPVTDDRPYFFNFFKWSSIREMLSLRRRGGAGLLEAGFLVVLATLAQALVASVVLIAAPLLVRRAAPHTDTPPRWRMIAYFFAIGLAFLIIEMAFIQRFVLFLGHPVYAVTVVLATFLLAGGLGSVLAMRSGTHDVRAPVTLIVAFGLAHAFAVPPLLDALLALPTAVRHVISAALIAPLALPMGMMFPRALDWIGERHRALVPFAWGVNGCASVVAAPLGIVLASAYGFTAALLGALGLYVVASVVAFWPPK